MFSMVNKLIAGDLWDFNHYLIYFYEKKPCLTELITFVKCAQIVSGEYRGYASHHKQSTGVGRATEREKKKKKKFVFC